MDWPFQQAKVGALGLGGSKAPISLCMKLGHKSQQTWKAGALAQAQAEVKNLTVLSSSPEQRGPIGDSGAPNPPGHGVGAEAPAVGQREGTSVGPGGPARQA